jgi:hypothetical protein
MTPHLSLRVSPLHLWRGEKKRKEEKKKTGATHPLVPSLEREGKLLSDRNWVSFFSHPSL